MKLAAHHYLVDKTCNLRSAFLVLYQMQRMNHLDISYSSFPRRQYHQNKNHLAKKTKHICKRWIPIFVSSICSRYFECKQKSIKMAAILELGLWQTDENGRKTNQPSDRIQKYCGYLHYFTSHINRTNTLCRSALCQINCPFLLQGPLDQFAFF